MLLSIVHFFTVHFLQHNKIFLTFTILSNNNITTYFYGGSIKNKKISL